MYSIISARHLAFLFGGLVLFKLKAEKEVRAVVCVVVLWWCEIVL